ncbi:hypothetical protein [Arcanobacterium hippocoleae]|uniref:hypothetical protein n=1 Tax=Arcanobacterium hippocoleae TaxID=149017 RepID=UPI00334032F3
MGYGKSVAQNLATNETAKDVKEEAQPDISITEETAAEKIAEPDTVKKAVLQR